MTTDRAKWNRRSKASEDCLQDAVAVVSWAVVRTSGNPVRLQWQPSLLGVCPPYIELLTSTAWRGVPVWRSTNSRRQPDHPTHPHQVRHTTWDVLSIMGRLLNWTGNCYFFSPHWTSCLQDRVYYRILLFNATSTLLTRPVSINARLCLLRTSQMPVSFFWHEFRILAANTT